MSPADRKSIDHFIAWLRKKGDGKWADELQRQVPAESPVPIPPKPPPPINNVKTKISVSAALLLLAFVCRADPPNIMPSAGKPARYDVVCTIPECHATNRLVGWMQTIGSTAATGGNILHRNLVFTCPICKNQFSRPVPDAFVPNIPPVLVLEGGPPPPPTNATAATQTNLQLSEVYFFYTTNADGSVTVNQFGQKVLNSWAK